MKVFLVVAACADTPTGLHAPTALGAFRTRNEALDVLRREWERIEYCIEEGEELEPERRQQIDEEWSVLELPILVAGEDTYDVIECEIAENER